jgi:hypothetical protein
LNGTLETWGVGGTHAIPANDTFTTGHTATNLFYSLCAFDADGSIIGQWTAEIHKGNVSHIVLTPAVQATSAPTACADTSPTLASYTPLIATTASSVADKIAALGSSALILDADDAVVAYSPTELKAGALVRPIKLDYTKSPVSGAVWSGADAEGSLAADANCESFTSAAGTGDTGTVGAKGIGWRSGGSSLCNASAHVYCLEGTGPSLIRFIVENTQPSAD